MMDLGPHAAFIWAAYGAVTGVIGALTAWIVIDARRQRQILDELQSKGVTRRSARGDAKPEDASAQ